MKEKTNQWQEVSSSLMLYSLFCVPVQERKLRGRWSLEEQQQVSACFLHVRVFSVSRCLAEPCVSIDLAGCKRTVADSRD